MCASELSVLSISSCCPHSKLPSQHTALTACHSSLTDLRAHAPTASHACAVLVAGGIITDLVSYYTLPSSVIGNDKYDSLKAAFMYYTVATKTPLQDLMHDILVLAGNRYGYAWKCIQFLCHFACLCQHTTANCQRTLGRLKLDSNRCCLTGVHPAQYLSGGAFVYTFQHQDLKHACLGAICGGQEASETNTILIGEQYDLCC